MLRSWKRDLSGKLGTHWRMGVVAQVSIVGALVLLSLLLLLVDMSLFACCLCLMCLGGCHWLARLAGEGRKWVLMLFLLSSFAFYPRVGVSCDIFLSRVGLGCFWRAPTYCHFLDIPSTWSGIGVCTNYVSGLKWPQLRIVLLLWLHLEGVWSSSRHIP